MAQQDQVLLNCQALQKVIPAEEVHKTTAKARQQGPYICASRGGAAALGPGGSSLCSLGSQALQLLLQLPLG